MSTFKNHPSPSQGLSRWHQWPQMIIIGSLFTLLAACGAGSTGTDSAANGDVIVGLTDAPGNSATYTVDVDSLTLTRNNGAEVETLPVQTRVDFAQYTDLTEFLTAATVPNGVYTKATMVLDYTHADIQVEDPGGNIVPVPIANIVDIDGNPIQKLTVSVRLDGSNKLLVAPGLPANMTLDFNLQASNRVDFSAADPMLTVAPFLVADLSLDKPKIHRLRGALASVDLDNQKFKLIVRPFRHRLSVDNRHFGTLNVHVDSATVYEINGESFIGDTGLQALNNQPAHTAVIAIGKLQLPGTTARRRFVATQVYAGSSVPNGDSDVVTGHIIARSGNTLQLKGATLIRKDGTVIFNNTVTVQLSPSTVVKKQLSADAHDISEISVGQRLTVFGQANIATDASGVAITLDASQGTARMLFTNIRGAVAQTASPLALKLNTIGHRPVNLFDFSGTGINAANDADPAFYELDTGALDLSSLVVNEPVKARGFVTAFGSAPADFNARSLMLVAPAKALLMTSWQPASATAISDISATRILLDLTGSGHFHHVIRAGERTDLTGFSSMPTLIPADETGKGLYIIIQKRAAALILRDFSTFTRRLSELLNNGAKVKAIKAQGYFNDDNVTMRVWRTQLILR